MVNYFSKIIVLSDLERSFLTLDCDVNQIHLSVEDFTLSFVNNSMHTERQNLCNQLSKEKEKKEENHELFFRACANINLEA